MFYTKQTKKSIIDINWRCSSKPKYWFPVVSYSRLFRAQSVRNQTAGRFVPEPPVDSYPNRRSIVSTTSRFVPEALVDSYPNCRSIRTHANIQSFGVPLASAWTDVDCCLRLVNRVMWVTYQKNSVLYPGLWSSWQTPNYCLVQSKCGIHDITVHCLYLRRS